MSLMDTGNEAAQTTVTDDIAMDGANPPLDAAPANQGPGQTSPPEWSITPSIPGDGPVPDWFRKDKYGTVEDQAKAYKALESRFGAFTGAPKDGKYEAGLSDELKEMGIEFGDDDPFYESMVEFAKESQMNQEGFSKMMNIYAMSRVAESKALEQFRQDELKSLGDNAQARIDNLLNWGKANLDDETMEGFSDMAVSASAIRAMEKLVSLTRSAPIQPQGAVSKAGISHDELRAMQFEKDEFGNRRLSTDPEFRRKFEKIASQVWGSDEHRVVVGS